MRAYRPLLLAATLLAVVVITLGAYVRLSDAGLGCPDWPGCYGHWIGVPDTPHEHAAALAAFPDAPVETHKAWKEMLHRYLAGALGALIAAIAVLAWRHRARLERSPALPTGLLALVVLQAALGMWTVTLLLKPVIVSLHLIGGMSTLALLVWLVLRQNRPAPRAVRAGLRAHAALALALVALQIALGGWVSSNYAALACTDLPTCAGSWVPPMDFARAFSFVRELGQTADGEALPQQALVAIHWTHRVGALIVALVAGTLALRLWRAPLLRRWGGALGTALVLQLALGVANVVLYLPLAVAVAHNAGAALLLTTCLAIHWRLGRPAGVSARTGLPLPPQPAGAQFMPRRKSPWGIGRTAGR